MMWVLWLMLLVHGEPTHHQLNHFTTRAECETMRVLVEAEMHKAYPDDRDLRVSCTRQSI